MSNRNSSISQSYRGTDLKTVRNTADSWANKVSNGDGSDKTQPAALTKLLGNANVPASVDPVSYGVIKSHFVARGASLKNATSLALLTIDAAKVQGISPMELIHTNFSDNDVMMSADVMYLMNLLGNTNSRVGQAKPKTNRNSYKASYIRV